MKTQTAEASRHVMMEHNLMHQVGSNTASCLNVPSFTHTYSNTVSTVIFIHIITMIEGEAEGQENAVKYKL